MDGVGFSLDNAVVYDVETLVNAFTLSMELFNKPLRMTWEISEFRDDRDALLTWFYHLQITQTPMIGFNNVHFDYPVIHFIKENPSCRVEDIHAKAMAIIAAQGDQRFNFTIWPDNRFAPQVDLYKINHFDNRAKSTSLKALQINMRSPTVVDSPVPFDRPLTQAEIENDLIPYNQHDVQETKRFGHICRQALDFRIGMIDQFGIDVMNFNDTKIGVKIVESKLGEGLCYEWREYRDSYGNIRNKRVARQTQRDRIDINDLILPIVRFDHPEFKRVETYLRQQVLLPDDMKVTNDEGVEHDITYYDSFAVERTLLKTKGVFTNLIANVGDIPFKFGTGGMHGSIRQERLIASDEWPIWDIDVAGQYPRFMIINELAPAHLGPAFTEVFKSITAERALHAKGTVRNAALKLANNGTFGNTNALHGPLRDPLVAMTTTINCQLLICMLAEWLVTVPTLRLIQVNTDGITYQIHRDHQPLAETLQRYWEAETQFVLEQARYSHMWIADVNTYVARDFKGKLKIKGRFWYPDPERYYESISESVPPAWHKDLGNVVSPRAAVQAMVHGVDPADWIRRHDDPFDFMCRAKVDRQSKLMLGERQIQSTSRYYVAKHGAPLVKVSPSKGPDGWYKKANGITDAAYSAIMSTNGGAWDERVCTKNKSRYETRRIGYVAGYEVAECNDARSFDFAKVNYDFYIDEAKKLIIQ